MKREVHKACSCWIPGMRLKSGTAQALTDSTKPPLGFKAAVPTVLPDCKTDLSCHRDLWPDAPWLGPL